MSTWTHGHMETYFELTPLDVKIEILSKCSWKDVENLFLVITDFKLVNVGGSSVRVIDVESYNTLGRRLSFKEFGIIPKESYAWTEVFKIYYKVRQLGFDRFNIKNPLIDRQYDNILHEYIRPIKLTLANSYGITPSVLLRFLYRENIYDKSPDILIGILIPLYQIHDYQSIEDILDFIIQKYGNLASLPGAVGGGNPVWPEYRATLDDIFDKILLDEPIDVEITIRLLEKLKLLSPVSKDDYDAIDTYLRAHPANDKVIKTLIKIFPNFFERDLLLYGDILFIDIIKRFNIDVQFHIILTRITTATVKYILHSGKYTQELSDKDSRQRLIVQIYNAVRQDYNLEYFLEMITLINEIMLL